MICPKCKKEMKNVMHFENGRKYQYNRCPFCYERTKTKRIHFEDVVTEEKENKKL